VWLIGVSCEAVLEGLVILGILAGAPTYGSAREGAEVIGNLGRFLESYVGDCLRDDPEFNKAQCEAVARSYRDKSQGKLFRVDVEDMNGMLQFAGWDGGRNAFRLLLTPFFGERGLAVTVGKPSTVSSSGPVIKNMPIWVKSETKEDGEIRRAIDRGMVRLELLMRPGKPWALKSKDGKDVFRGVDVALVGLRLYGTRANAVLSEQTYP
jgi:hypothetical protein